MIENLIIPGVTNTPVTISGKWSALPEREWQGCALSPIPIVAILFLRVKNTVKWCLCGRSTGNTTKVRLSLFPYDDTNLDVQINASIGGGRFEGIFHSGGILRFRTLVPSPLYLPETPTCNIFETGRIIRISAIKGNPKIDFLVLFLARDDVNSKRNGIWHIRSKFLEYIPESLYTPLTYGRTGLFEDN